MTAVAPCGVWAKVTCPSTTSRRSRVTLWRPCTTCWQAATSPWACTPRRLLHRSSSLLLRPTTSSHRPLCGLLGCADRSQTFRLGLRGIFGCPLFLSGRSWLPFRATMLSFCSEQQESPMVAEISTAQWIQDHPLIQELVALREVTWFNPAIAPATLDRKSVV